MAPPLTQIPLQARYGKLTVIGWTARRHSNGHRQYICRCDCGNRVVVIAGNLKSGNSTSCGCHKAAVLAAGIQLRHGHSRKTVNGVDGRTRTYNSWRSMWDRCTCPKLQSYRYYGARGISVCDRWADFEAFLEDMGERPAGRTIDRLDSDGDYEPDNCQWSTPTEQIHNRRSTRSAP
jgi:hypothetical protein